MLISAVIHNHVARLRTASKFGKFLFSDVGGVAFGKNLNLI